MSSFDILQILQDIPQVLQYGIMGFGALLALFAYRLLNTEQKRPESPRPEILRSVHVFMAFSILLCVIGLVAQISDSRLDNNDSNNKELNVWPEEQNIRTLQEALKHVTSTNKQLLLDVVNHKKRNTSYPTRKKQRYVP